MLIGKEFGPYVVDTELGSGAMGTVFRAKSKKTGERVAIKLMSIALGTSETATARFTREVAILKQLDHPNIVKYKGSGRYLKSPFFIMEYVEGESLDHILHRRTRLPWEEVVDLGIHLCAALQHAHDKGIIHRDLKPSNLMILNDGVVKLTDFGIAKDTDVTALTAANSTVGTAAYMSPEQCRGVRGISHKTDLYSMGIMFYELLTGRKPFVGETAMEVFLQHANKTEYKTPGQIVLETPIWLDTLVCQLMEKEPAKRPLNANAVADSLRLIREKIEAQRSAGIDAATKRKIDRTSTDKKLDETDKEAARAMLGKRKKKEVKQPFYTRGWFTIAALSVIAVLTMTGIYYVFLKTPDAETLYSQAEVLMKSDSEGDHKRAREGPVTDFLRYYPGHEKVIQIQKWADQSDFELLDKQMHNRRFSKLKLTITKDEELAREALDYEDVGRLTDAAKLWKELSKNIGKAVPETHRWGLIGERYGLELKTVEERYAQFANKIASDQKAAGRTELEELALDAVRAEVAAENTKMPEEAKAHVSQAREKWQELKTIAAKKSDGRTWFLLGAKRWRELGEKK